MTNERAAFYEAGNICSYYYPVDDLPINNFPTADYYEALRLYELLRLSLNKYDLSSQIEEDEQDIKEDLINLRTHKRYDRRSIKKVKEVHGYTCKACGFNFE